MTAISPDRDPLSATATALLEAPTIAAVPAMPVAGVIVVVAATAAEVVAIN